MGHFIITLDALQFAGLCALVAVVSVVFIYVTIMSWIDSIKKRIEKRKKKNG